MGIVFSAVESVKKWVAPLEQLWYACVSTDSPLEQGWILYFLPRGRSEEMGSPAGAIKHLCI